MGILGKEIIGVAWDEKSMDFSLVNNIYVGCAKEFKPRVPNDAKMQ